MKIKVNNRFSGEFMCEIDTEAYLQGANLQEAYLQGADLQGANLRGADLQEAYLQGADLQGAYLRGAYLQGADLQGADLQGADLRGADLQGAKNILRLNFGKYETIINDKGIKIGCKYWDKETALKLIKRLDASTKELISNESMGKKEIDMIKMTAKMFWE